MALEPAQQNQVLRSALGMVSQRRGELDADGNSHLRVAASEIARQLRNRFPTMEGLTPQQARAIAQRAIAMEEAGRRVREGTIATVPGRELPRDPGISDHQPRYRYDVVIHFTDPSGQPQSVRVPFRSDTPLSAAELEAEALRWVDVDQYFGADNRRNILSALATQDVRIEVVYAARR